MMIDKQIVNNLIFGFQKFKTGNFNKNSVLGIFYRK